MDEIYFIYVFVLLIGACIGSFLNVVALRAMTKESIVLPASKCPSCGTPIKWYDNIPVVSYLFTIKGKCRSCGCHVSIQYPIVEAITSILFLLSFMAFGFSWQTLLLIILLCISIVITITDIKKGIIFDIHSWGLIIFAIVYSVVVNGIENYSVPAIGLISAVIIMELIAKFSYYLIKNNTEEETSSETPSEMTDETKNETSETNTEKEASDSIEQADEAEMDINEYVNKNKRAFGEGDTYIAAASGALLGWKFFILAIVCSIVFQAFAILPQFLVKLFKQKEYVLLTSLTCFIAVALVYWIISNMFELSILIVFPIVILLFSLAIVSLKKLKSITKQEGYVAIPFGPALLFASFIVLFFGNYILIFLKRYIFWING